MKLNRKKNRLTIIGLAALIVFGSFSLPVLSEVKMSKDIEPGNTAFALDLYKELQEEQGNLFLSPYSISTALAMTYAGAKKTTAEQMADVLHFDLPRQELHQAFEALESRLNTIQKQGDILLSVANSIWPQVNYPFLKEYLELVKTHYKGTITPLDYKKSVEKARQIINTWVEEKTMDKIKELLQQGILSPLTRMVLVNAIYFKGNWANQFKSDRTADQQFFPHSGPAVMVPMMMQEEKFKYGENESVQVIELPYAGEELSMVVVLPKQKSGLGDIEKNLTPDMYKTWTANLRKQKVNLFFPRFKMTSQFRLDDTLTAMGMTDAFNPAKADFSGMDGRLHWLFIGAVIHKAFVEVNEEGTEAAAATAVVMRLTSAAPHPPVVFRADHPFLFFIKDNGTGSILFMGRLANPKAKD